LRWRGRGCTAHPSEQVQDREGGRPAQLHMVALGSRRSALGSGAARRCLRTKCPEPRAESRKKWCANSCEESMCLGVVCPWYRTDQVFETSPTKLVRARGVSSSPRYFGANYRCESWYIFRNSLRRIPTGVCP
jgi:hypothetical protein